MPSRAWGSLSFAAAGPPGLGRHNNLSNSAPAGLLILLLPIESEEREVLGVGSIPVAILPSCYDMKTIVL